METPEPIGKKLAQLITSGRRPLVPNFVQIGPRGLLGKCVKYNWFFLFIPFFGNSPTGQTAWWIFTRNGSNDAVSPKDVHFWGYKVQNHYLMPKKSRKGENLGLQSPKSIFNSEKSRKRWKNDQIRDLEIFRRNIACMKFTEVNCP